MAAIERNQKKRKVVTFASSRGSVSQGTGSSAILDPLSGNDGGDSESFGIKLQAKV